MSESVVNANRVVAYNLERARKARGLSQEEARELLKVEGIDWSKATYSAAERSWDGKRVRQFEADELVAFARAFEVPVIFFFLPPRPADRDEVTAVSVGGPDISWSEMLDVILGGKFRMLFAQRVVELPRSERANADAFLTAMIGTPRSLEEYAEIRSQGEAAFASRAPERSEP